MWGSLSIVSGAVMGSIINGFKVSRIAFPSNWKTNIDNTIEKYRNNCLENNSKNPLDFNATTSASSLNYFQLNGVAVQCGDEQFADPVTSTLCLDGRKFFNLDSKLAVCINDRQYILIDDTSLRIENNNIFPKDGCVDLPANTKIKLSREDFMVIKTLRSDLLKNVDESGALIAVCNESRISHVYACPVGTRLDETTLECVELDSRCVNVPNWSIIESDTTTNVYRVCVDYEVREIVCPANHVFDSNSRRCRSATRCLNRENGTKFPGNDPTQYIECFGEREITRVCPIETIFDVRSLTCKSQACIDDNGVSIAVPKAWGDGQFVRSNQIYKCSNEQRLILHTNFEEMPFSSDLVLMACTNADQLNLTLLQSLNISLPFTGVYLEEDGSFVPIDLLRDFNGRYIPMTIASNLLPNTDDVFVGWLEFNNGSISFHLNDGIRRFDGESQSIVMESNIRPYAYPFQQFTSDGTPCENLHLVYENDTCDPLDFTRNFDRFWIGSGAQPSTNLAHVYESIIMPKLIIVCDPVVLNGIRHCALHAGGLIHHIFDLPQYTSIATSITKPIVELDFLIEGTLWFPTDYSFEYIDEKTLLVTDLTTMATENLSLEDGMIFFSENIPIIVPDTQCIRTLQTLNSYPLPPLNLLRGYSLPPNQTIDNSNRIFCSTTYETIQPVAQLCPNPNQFYHPITGTCVEFTNLCLNQFGESIIDPTNLNTQQCTEFETTKFVNPLDAHFKQPTQFILDGNSNKIMLAGPLVFYYTQVKILFDRFKNIF